MRSFESNYRFIFIRLGVVGAAVAAIVVFGGGCETGGDEGNKCNPLVLRDECNSGLRCTPASCSEAYCCPTARSSSDPHCNAEGCPAPDAGADAAPEAEAEDAGADTGVDAAGDTGADTADTGADAGGDAGDGSDSG